MWAAQIGQSAVEHRLKVPVRVTGGEAWTWLMALYELCTLINVIHGNGTAEGIMYETEEVFRGAFDGTSWDKGRPDSAN
jgi:hypothetical protein